MFPALAITPISSTPAINWGQEYISAISTNNRAYLRVLTRSCDVNTVFKGLTVHPFSSADITPLMICCTIGDIASLEVLFKEGADLDYSVTTRGETATATALAIRLHRNEIVRRLYEENASVLCLNPQEESAVHLCAKYGNEELLLYFLAKGFSPNLLDKEEKTPLMHAAQGGHWQCVQHLLNYVANVMAVDRLGRSALSNTYSHLLSGTHSDTNSIGLGTAKQTIVSSLLQRNACLRPLLVSCVVYCSPEEREDSTPFQTIFIAFQKQIKASLALRASDAADEHTTLTMSTISHHPQIVSRLRSLEDKIREDTPEEARRRAREELNFLSHEVNWGKRRDCIALWATTWTGS